MNGLAFHSYNVLGVCAGVGGLELGIHIAEPRARGICYVERELYAAAALAARMEEGALDPAPIWADLGSFDGRRFRGLVDCLASGDPCQPNSVAGKRAGSSDDRWLIDQVVRVVDQCRPARFFRENVSGNADGQLAALVPALEGMGYRVAAGIFSAGEIGAAHKRERLFIMADRDSGGRGLGGQSELAGLSSQSGDEPDRRGGAGSMADTRRGALKSQRDASELRSPEGEAQGAGDIQRRAPRDRGPAPVADADGARHDDGGSGAGGPLRDQARRAQSDGRGLGVGSGAETWIWRDSAGSLADASGSGFQGGEFERACNDERLGPDAHGSIAELCGSFLLAPGPADCAWPILLDADPLLAPAVGAIDLWALARRNLGLPALVDPIGRRGGMVWDLDSATAAKVKSEVHRISNGLAHRLDRLRACGNGVVPLAAAVAWLCLAAKLAAASRPTLAALRAA